MSWERRLGKGFPLTRGHKGTRMLPPSVVLGLQTRLELGSHHETMRGANLRTKLTPQGTHRKSWGP